MSGSAEKRLIVLYRTFTLLYCFVIVIVLYSYCDCIVIVLGIVIVLYCIGYCHWQCSVL